MKQTILPLFLAASVALVGCDKKNDDKSTPAPSSTQASVTPATNSSLPSPILAAIDVQKIIDASSATTGIREEIEKKRSEIQKEMTEHESKLRSQEQVLAEQSQKLSKAEFQKKREQFEKQVAEVQLKLNVRKLQLETAFEQARSKVYDAFLEASNSVRQEIGANIILYKEQVVLADNAFDITQPVLDRLNAELPKVQVEYQSEDEIMKKIQAQS